MVQDLSAVEDLRVAGDFVIPAAIIREQIQWARDHSHASCYFQRYEAEGGNSIIVVVDLYDDRWPTKSVTNDAEYVVRLAVQTQGDFPIVYRDTEGRWDELRHRKGNFACFRALDTHDLNLAIDRALAYQGADSQHHGTN